MPRVFLVRHGQASFGAEDYDQLSPLGQIQCAKLGALWQAQGLRFGTVMRGTLRRHAQSLVALQGGLGQGGGAQVLPGLDEYDSEALLRALAQQPAHAAPLARVADAAQAREHFRRLREALLQWMRGDLAPVGMPSYVQFRAGIVQALMHAREASRTGDVLVVSSGGPISTALAHVLDSPHESAVALNMRLRNSAVCTLASTARGLELETFNALPHLEGEAGMQTHA